MQDQISTAQVKKYLILGKMPGKTAIIFLRRETSTKRRVRRNLKIHDLKMKFYFHHQMEVMLTNI